MDRSVSRSRSGHPRRYSERVLIVGGIIKAMSPFLISLGKALIAGCSWTIFLGGHGGVKKRGGKWR